MEKKVFGYPKYDDNGEMILTTYENEYRDMLMDIRVYKLEKTKQKYLQVISKKLRFYY